MSENEHTDIKGFPIIGIGASAGGLDALERFLANVPEKSGMAFVIIQHLDPTRNGILVELLQRSTSMDVLQVSGRTSVKQDCVYVIPPNKDMSINGGELHLFDPVLPRGLRLPIDFFFRSLADGLQDQSIGVILSGMGTDGTLGLRAIKDKGGAVFVQEPQSAKFTGMPSSAIDAGLADVVSPVEMLPAKIIAYLRHKHSIHMPETAIADQTQNTLGKVLILLQEHTGHDFSSYKKTTVYRRIERRMGIHQINEIADYVSFLQENPKELELLFKELLIGVTSFFRDPAEWELIKEQVFPVLLAGRAPSQSLRAWIPACATGEEAYSLAIIFKEVLEQLKPAHNYTLQIFATDLDSDAIDKAREAVFPVNIAADVSPERLSRFFIPVERGYQVAKSIRDMVIFAPQNIIMDPTFTRLDILSCRNLLIYLTQEMQKKLLPLFHNSLNPGGFLFLGSSETIGSFDELFEPLKGKSRLYRRLDSPMRAEPVEFPSSFVRVLTTASQPLKPPLNLQSLANQLLLERYSLPAVLVNDKGDILYINGKTGKYLEPAAGKANWNIFAMAREGLHHVLTDAFQKALRKKDAVTVKHAVVINNHGTQMFNFTVQPISAPEALRGMLMIVFTDVLMHPETKVKGKRASVSSEQTAELERELEQARQELYVNCVEMQISQEELKSINEEWQSTNEELQSTNEEMTTSKEEMQSLNEELQTINQELQIKIDELSLTNNDMKNLLDSTEIAMLFMDKMLHVRRFTNQMSAITKLIPGDIGRPVTDIASELFYPELAEDVKEVLRTLKSVEKQVDNLDGSWFNVRILPYRTLDGTIDGVVVTFVDITVSKTLEAVLLKTQATLEERVADQDGKLEQTEDRLKQELQRTHKEVAAGKTRKRNEKPEKSS